MHPEVPILSGEGRVVQHSLVERNNGRHALDNELLQRPTGSLQCLLTIRASDDDLGDQRVEAARHCHAVEVTIVDSDARP
jgi:hypothetical protein